MRNAPAYGWRKPKPSELYQINGQAVPALKFRREAVYVSDGDTIARQTAMLADPAHLAWLASPPEADSDAGMAPPRPESAEIAPEAGETVSGPETGNAGEGGASELDRARAELVRLGVLVANSWTTAA